MIYYAPLREETMQNRKNEQLSLSEYHEQQAKKKKKLIDLPWPVILIFTIPFIFFAILLLGYVFFIRGISANG
jgi:hypothetical protein